MNIYVKAVGLICFAFLSFKSFASDLDNCVLNGLKGVNSDIAARMVRQACENKVNEQRNAELFAKFGDRLDDPMDVVTWAAVWQGETLNVLATLRNLSSQTALYVELGVATPDEKDKCPYSGGYRKKFLYQVKLKPDSVGTFVVPNGAAYRKRIGGGLCMSANVVRARSPKFTDVSLGTFSPLSDREVLAINSQLNTSYTFPPPEPAPAAAKSSITDFTQDDLIRALRK
jgi:hypothetical protein